jgi:type I restriction enzyme S subunit
MTGSHGITPLSVGDRRAAAPKNWAWRRLTSCARLESGHTPSRYHPEWWGGTIPWISLTDIRELDGKVAHETREYTNEAGLANSSARVLPAGTVALSRTASVGFVTIMGREMATSQDFVNWVCGPDLDPRFLAYLFRASRMYLRSLSSGAIHQTIYMPTVEAFEVCIPDLKEQQRIVGSVDEQFVAVERARAAAVAQLEAAKGLPAAYLKEMFESPEVLVWPQRRLGDLMRLRKEVVYPLEQRQGRAVFVGLEHVASGTGARVGSVSIEMGELTGRKPMFYEGDIVYGYLRPYLNKVWVANFEGLCSVDQYVYSVDPQEADTRFIAAFMRSQVYLARAPIQATPGQLPRIRTEEVASVTINLPPPAEQQVMIAQLEVMMVEVERMTRMAEVQVDTTSALPGALLRQAFSGEL